MARVLVVDDEKSIRNTFEIFLKKEHHSVFLAEDAAKAIDIINNNDIDIILTDIVMPKISGLELLDTINEKISDIPVIIMTGEPTLQTARKAVKDNAFDYLIKPISKDELLKAVDNAVAKKKMIDRQKSLEEQNRQYRSKLEYLLEKRTEALEIAQKITELSPTPTLIINLKSNKVFSVNKAMLNFMGSDNANEIKNYRFFESNDTYKELDKKLKANGKVDQAEVQIYKNGTNELVWCLLNIYPIEISNDVLHIISFTDINDEIEIQSNLRLAKNRAEEATKIKSEFLANMSHEIRTPINAIVGLNELMKQTKLNEKQKEYADKMSTSARILLHVINDILDFSKIESGKLSMEQTRISIIDIVENVVVQMTPEANKKKIKLITFIDENIPKYLIGDSIRLEQVLLNLVNNAVKFTEAGYVEIRAKLQAEYNNDAMIKFRIIDTGIGMTDEQTDRLFESFTQADASTTRKYGGSGLGLAISKNLVELMGGEIGVESEYGIGSKFFFTCRLKKYIENKDGHSHLIGIPSYLINEYYKEQETSGLMDLEIKHDAFKVLLVEDNAINQMVTKEILEFDNIIVDTADNGKIAVDMLKEGNIYDLIIMDIQMPVMGGYEAVGVIRKEMKMQDIPIIALSADAMEGSKEAALKHGMNDYVAKPIDHRLLREKILHYVKRA